MVAASPSAGGMVIAARVMPLMISRLALFLILLGAIGGFMVPPFDHAEMTSTAAAIIAVSKD